MKRTIIFILLAVLTIAAFYERGYFTDHQAVTEDQAGKLGYAFENQVSNLQVEGSGTVEKLLQDDTEGSRHQRFILRVSREQTVLVAHNIDLAPRVENMKKGDRVEFYGEYEWNKKGGVIHWTHRDPAANHVDGWIRHRNKLYQ